MANDMLVSIVINNYNYGRFLGDAICSALGQTYPNTETIVVDDGSTDDSRQVIASFGDRVIPLLKDNGGQASAINAGFAACRGDVVIFLDADDELLPEAAARVAAAFRGRPEMAKVMCPMEIIDELGVCTGAVTPARHLPLRSGDIRRHVLAFPYDLTWTGMGASAFSACVLRQILPVPEAIYRTCPDWYLSHLSALYGPVLFLKEIGARYRLHGANSYAVASLDLRQTRQSIEYMRTTSVAIAAAARRLGLSSDRRRPGDILSVSYVASRMVSLRLDRSHHPVGGDSIWSVLLDAARATGRRFDVGLPMKAMYLVWFALMAAAPRPLSRRLAELFFFPETRPRISKLLGLLEGRDKRERGDYLRGTGPRRSGGKAT